MPAPADRALIAHAVRLVADGMSYSEAARAVGSPPCSVRVWCLRSGVRSRGAGINLEAWKASEVSQDLSAPENASTTRPRGRPGLYVGFTSDALDGYRPSPADVRDAEGLQAAMERWACRVATSTAADHVERNVHSSWDASTR